jgi:hypothetical protein
MASKTVEVFMYICERCGYAWVPRKQGRPLYCASRRCHSPKWDVARQQEGVCNAKNASVK